MSSRCRKTSQVRSPVRCGRRSRGTDVPAVNFEAMKQDVIGLHHWNRRLPQALVKAREHLTKAVELEPSLAAAAGSLALSHVTEALYGLEAPRVAMPMARAAAERALVLDPQEPGALAARACIRGYDGRGGRRAALPERDRRLPDHAIARQWFAINLLAPLGRFDEARACLVRARELDPLSPSAMVSAGFVEFLAGDVAQGIAHCERALALDPAFSAGRTFSGPC